jgi:PIN domain nuclease of toxin-antitoxin system
VRVLIDTMVLIWAAQQPAHGGVERTVETRDCHQEPKRKLNLPEADLHKALDDLDIRILSYAREHALKLFGLPWHHSDPFDRQILAQALAEEISIVTSDEVFGRYEGVRVIW